MKNKFVLVSATLMTLALVWLLPSNLRLASTWRIPYLNPTSGYYVYNYERINGTSGLALITVGLIVLWTGYQRRLAWTWFVMLVITCLYFFPVYFLPILQSVSAGGATWGDFLRNPVVDRRINPYTATLFAFLIMVIGLVIPIRCFFGPQQGKATSGD